MWSVSASKAAFITSGLTREHPPGTLHIKNLHLAPCDSPDLPFFTGGLLICLPREQAARFCAEIKSPKYGEGHQAWIIGIVEKGNRTARIIDKPRIIEVAPQAATQNVNPTPGATS